MSTTHVQVGSLTLELPIVPLPNTPISIILFDSFGKTQLIQEVAQEALKHFTKPQVIVCPEAKAIPLTQEMARLWNIDYVVLRKGKKLYMKQPRHIDVHSITTRGDQQLWYDMETLSFLQNKEIMLFDDVVSTGGTLAALVAFAEENALRISSIATIFLEGQSALVEKIQAKYPVESLGFLPLLENVAE